MGVGVGVGETWRPTVIMPPCTCGGQAGEQMCQHARDLDVCELKRDGGSWGYVRREWQAVDVVIIVAFA